MIGRSEIMRSVKSKDTGPELTVRRLLHSLGYRYNLHRRDLPGKPDIVFPSRRKVIFVNGCFWHQHDCPRGARSPKANRDYWQPKLRRNRERDELHRTDLNELGWGVLVIWECETKNAASLERRLRDFLKVETPEPEMTPAA